MMKILSPLSLKAAVLSIALLGTFLLVWHLATLPKASVQAADSEYAKLMGGSAPKTTGLPTPMQIAETIWKQAKDPFYDNGPNDKGIGIQIAYSLARVMAGFLLAAAVAIPDRPSKIDVPLLGQGASRRAGCAADQRSAEHAAAGDRADRCAGPGAERAA